MTQLTPWKILIYACGNASEHLSADQPPKAIDIAALFDQPAGAFKPVNGILILEGHNPATRHAMRFVQEMGQSMARLVATLPAVDDSPAARDAFADWAMEAHPSQRTILFLADCTASPDELYPLPGTAFELIPSPDGPDQRPLSQDTLDGIKSDVGPGPFADWLTTIESALIGRT
jgi:hypothetical protein